MSLTVKEIKEHQDYYGIDDLSAMSIEEYKRALDEGAFFWIDHHDFVRDTLSEKIFATNIEQLDALVDFLNKFRDKM